MHVLGLVRRVEQRLGAVGELARGRIQHDASYVGTDARVTRLVGQHHDVSLALEAAARIFACVDLPAPSPPSKHTNNPVEEYTPGKRP